MRVILASLGFGWSKWETIEENKRMMRQDSNPVIGYESEWYPVVVDVQKRTNSISGKVQYKNVKR